jgi:hypothetical protein
MSCAQGSPGSEPGQRAHRPCSPASVRTGPTGIQVRGCVGVHTHGKRASLVRTAAAPPFCLPCPPPYFCFVCVCVCGAIYIYMYPPSACPALLLTFVLCVCVCVVRYIFICILFSLGVRCVCVCVCVCVVQSFFESILEYLSIYLSIYLRMYLSICSWSLKCQRCLCWSLPFACVCVYYCSTYEKAVRVGGLVCVCVSFNYFALVLSLYSSTGVAAQQVFAVEGTTG